MPIEDIPFEVLRNFFIPCLKAEEIIRVDNAASCRKFRSNFLSALRHSTLPQVRKRVLKPEGISWVVKREVSLTELHFSSSCDDDVIDSIPDLACRSLRRITIPRSRIATSRSINDLCSRSPLLEHVVSFTDKNVWRVLYEFPRLTHLMAGGACISRDVAGIIPTTSSVRQLTIDQSDVTDEDMAVIAPACPNLRNLGVEKCRGITDASLSLLNKHCGALRILRVACCPYVTSDGIIALSSGYSQLEELDLSELGIGDNALNALAEHCTGLKKLMLNNCTNAGDEGIIRIVTSCRSIEHLSLINLRISDNCLAMIGAHCADLDTIYLSDCNLITNDGIIQIALCVRLQELYLNRCVNVCDTALEAFSACCYLRVAEFENCTKLTSDGLHKFVQHHSSLNRLSVRGCHTLSSQFIPNLTIMDPMPLQDFKCIGCTFSKPDVSKLKEKHPQLCVKFV